MKKSQEFKAASVLGANLPALTWKVSMTIPKFPADFYQNSIQHDQTVSKPKQRNYSTDDVNKVNYTVFNWISS